jgi:hypothetical protein
MSGGLTASVVISSSSGSPPPPDGVDVTVIFASFWRSPANVSTSSLDILKLAYHTIEGYNDPEE